MPRFKSRELRAELDARGLTDIEVACRAGLCRDTIRTARLGRPVSRRSATAILHALSRHPRLPGAELLVEEVA